MNFTYTDADTLTVKTVDGVTGIASNGGDITLVTEGTISITGITTGSTSVGTVKITSNNGNIEDAADLASPNQYDIIANTINLKAV